MKDQFAKPVPQADDEDMAERMRDVAKLLGNLGNDLFDTGVSGALINRLLDLGRDLLKHADIKERIDAAD